MGSLVLELQRNALDNSVSTTDLLRKALVVARKLRVHDLVEWLNHELNGYPDDANVPSYRRLRGELRVHNPYHGWIPLTLDSVDHANALSNRQTTQSIAELDKIANSEAPNVYMRLSKEVEYRLMQSMDIPLEPAVLLAKTQIHGLVSKVRNTVLDWALALEEQGIMGEGLSFSPEEKEQAGNVTLNIGSLGAMIGSMQDSQMQQGTVNSSQTYTKPLDLTAISKVVDEIRASLNKGSLEKEDAAQVDSDLSSVEAQLRAPRPNAGVIRESLRSTRTILEGVASSAIFQGIITTLKTVL